MRPINEILKNYSVSEEYALVLEYARRLLSKVNTEEELIKQVEIEFGPAPEIYRPEDYTGRPLHPFGQQLIEPLAIHEMREIMTLPPVTYAALMPDAHPMGKPGIMPVGGVMAMEKAIMPSAIGVDISCMVQLVITDFPVDRLNKDAEALADLVIANTKFGIGAEYTQTTRKDHAVLSRPEWDNPALGVSLLKDTAWKQLGTSGSGNHFVDLVEVELDVHLNKDIKANTKYVGILSHSGSRGVGFKVAQEYTKIASNWFNKRSKGYLNGLGYLPLDTEAGSAYFIEMTLMGHFADANHEIIASDICQALGAQPLFVIRSRHNFAFIHKPTGWIIHRKGATPAGINQLGLLPGTAGTPSFITMGLGNSNSLNSSAHGAGRVGSRAQAKSEYDEKLFREFMKAQGVVERGVASDETPFAYKDIFKVIDAQEGVLTKTVGEMFPRVVVMGG